MQPGRKVWPFGRNATVDDVFKATASEGGLVPGSTVNLPIVDSTPVITDSRTVNASRRG